MPFGGVLLFSLLLLRKNMKIISLVFLALFASQGLMGCQIFNTASNQQNAKGLSNSKDSCGRKHFKRFIGTAFDDINLIEEFSLEFDTQIDDGSGVWTWKDNDYFIQVLDPRLFMLTGEEHVIVANYSPKRLNVFLSNDGVIEKLECG